MARPILIALLFFLLVAHVESQQRRGIADGLVNDQFLAIRHQSEDVIDQHRRHREDPRKQGIDRTDQRQHHSRTHRRGTIDETEDRRHGQAQKQETRTITTSDQGRQSRRTRIDRQFENTGARNQLPEVINDRIRAQREQYRRRVDPRRHNVRRVNPRAQAINQGTDDMIQRITTRDRRFNQSADTSTHGQRAHQTGTSVTGSEIGDKNQLERAIELRRRILPNGQRGHSRVAEQRRREYQRILEERRRVQGTRSIDPKGISANDADDRRRFPDRATADPTGVNVERSDDSTGMGNREGAERIAPDSRKRDNPREIDTRRRHDPNRINTRVRAYPVGSDIRRRQDPSGNYGVDQHRVDSRLRPGVVDPRRSQIREGGTQRVDHRRHQSRSGIRGEVVDPRRTRVRTHGQERVDRRRSQIEVSDHTKRNERVNQRTQNEGRIVDTRTGRVNSRDDQRNEQNDRRVDTNRRFDLRRVQTNTRTDTNRRFDPRRVQTNTRTDLRRVSTSTDARRVYSRDPMRTQASVRGSQQNADITKTRTDQDRSIDRRRQNRRRTITDPRRTQAQTRASHPSRHQGTNESNHRTHHPRPHGHLEAKAENTSKLTIERSERIYESLSSRPSPIKEQGRDTVIHDERKNIADRRTVSGGDTVFSGNVDRHRTSSSGRNRVDERTLTDLRVQRERILRERELERQRQIREREEQERRIAHERENRQRLENIRHETVANPRPELSNDRVNLGGGTVNQNTEGRSTIHDRGVGSIDQRQDRRRRIDPRRVQYYERTIVPSTTNVDRSTQHSSRREPQRANGRIADLQDTGRQANPQSLHGNHNGHPNIALSDGVIIGGPLGLNPTSANNTYISDSTIISRVYKRGSSRPIERVLVRSRQQAQRTRTAITEADPTGVGLGNARRTIRRQGLPPTGPRRSGSAVSNPDSTAVIRPGNSLRRQPSDPVRHGPSSNRRTSNEFPERRVKGPKGVIPGAVLE